MSTASAASSVDVELHPTPHPLDDVERAKRMDHPVFGQVFTDHMTVTPYHAGEGWGRTKLVPFAPITISPAASVLHYGQAIFEGFKAYRQPDGGIKTFRAADHAARFMRSAQRLAMPELPVERFLAAVDALVRQDQAWTPPNVGESLYIRPLMFANESVLGVHASNEYRFLVMACPTAAYFAGGVKPVAVWITKDYVRAAPGGTGAAKCAGNYAASLLAQTQAANEGCNQVVWLDAVHHEYVEEMGGMNIFFVYQEGGRTVLVTPELTGTLLPGMTRASLLELGPDLGYAVEERRVTVAEWRAGVAEGRITEAFACGTAAVITPIGRVKSKEGAYDIHGNESGPVATRLRKTLLDIQHGLAPDPRGWMRSVV